MSDSGETLRRTSYSAICGAQSLAKTFKDYLRLIREEHMTVNGAAAMLGRPGEPLLRQGLHASAIPARGARRYRAQPPRGRPSGLCHLERIEALGWFIPAAKFFYLNTNLTCGRGSVRKPFAEQSPCLICR